MSDGRRQNCPYHWCSALVRAVPTLPPGGTLPEGVIPPVYPNRELIVAHDIVNPFLKGPCPASNHYVPWDMTAYIYLSETRYNQDLAKIEVGKRLREAQDEAPFRPSDNRSQSMRGPHRMGREPEPGSDDWVLGGRKDQDMADAPPAEGTPLAQGVQGQSLGGTGMASIPELSAAAGESLAQVLEAFAVIERAKAAIESSVSGMKGILRDAANPTMEAAITSAANARSMCEQAQYALNESAGMLEQFQTSIHS